MPIIAEVVPPELAPLLISLANLLAFLAALGLIVVVSQLVDILVSLLDHTVGRVPGVGSIIASSAQWLGAKITGALGETALGLDARIAQRWYVLGELARWASTAVNDISHFMLVVGTKIDNMGIIGVVQRGLNSLVGGVAAVREEAKIALRMATALDKALGDPHSSIVRKLRSAILKPIEGRLGKLEGWTYPHVQNVESELAKTVEPDIAALRDRATAIENQALRVYRDAAGVYHAVNVDAIAAAITIALPSLGWQFLKCSGLGGSFSKRGCGLWNGLEDVLGLLVDTALLASACEIIAPMETIVSEIAVPIVDTLTGIGAGLCKGSIGPPAVLDVPKLYLPANPGIVLNVV